MSGHVRRCAWAEGPTAIVSELCHDPQKPRAHAPITGQAAARRCCLKSLIASALAGVRVRRHAQRESNFEGCSNRVTNIDAVREGYRALNDREAIKVMVEF